MNDYEALLELMRSRRSVRQFEERPLTREQIERIIEAARWAPSNHNRQGWKFVVLDDREGIQELADRIRACLLKKFEGASRRAARQAEDMLRYATAFAGAPCVMLVMHKRSSIMAPELTADLPNPKLVSGEPLSVAMAVQNMLLAAQALGLGSCVMTAPLLAHEALMAIPDLPPGFEPTCVLAFGHPAEAPPVPHKRDVQEITEYVSSPPSQS